MRPYKFRGFDLDSKKIIHETYTGELFALANEGRNILIYEFMDVLDSYGKEIYSDDLLKIKEFKNIGFGLGFTASELESLEIEDIKGELLAEYTTDIKWDENYKCYVKCDETSVPYGDFFDCIKGHGKSCYPYYEIEVVGNINLK